MFLIRLFSGALLALIALATASAAEETPPRLLSRDVQPVYPEAARSAGVTGLVFFAARIDESGKVADVEILDVPAQELGFERAVREAVMTWSFEPARRDGEPVAATYHGRVKYSLDDPDDAVYPGTRIYPLAPRDVWQEALALALELGFRLDVRDDDEQLLATRPLSWRKKTRAAFDGLDFARLMEDARPTFIRLHLLVSPHVEPARVHVNAAVGLRTGDGTFLSAHGGVVEEWFLARLDDRIGQEVRRLPVDSKRRTALARELSDGLPGMNLDCWSVWEAHDPSAPTSTVSHEVANPELIEETRAFPEYPESDRLNRRRGATVMRALLLEDGSVQRVEVLRSAGARTEFDLSSAQALRFWRYRPARTGGCPVPVYLSVKTTFSID